MTRKPCGGSRLCLRHSRKHPGRESLHRVGKGIGHLLHPSYLALSRDPAGRQRAYTALLAPSADPRADTRDPRWTSRRAVGSLGFLARYGARRRRPMQATAAPQDQQHGC